jgi:membrane protein
MVDLREPTTGMRAPSDEPVAELMQRAARQTADLVRQELHLAQVELKQKGRRAGIGAGVFGAAGVIAFLGAATLVAAAVLGLANAVTAWLAALIVGGGLLVVAAIVGMVGKRQATKAMPPTPDRAMESIHDDVEHLKEQASR